MRLQVYLARAGISSRRAAEEIIAGGRVSINGKIVCEKGTKVLPDDIILLDGKRIDPEKQKVYIALNKPPEYICASSDPQGRPLALDLISDKISERLYSVGRLDFLSCGLIFFTNDGYFAEKLGHPSSGLEKEYLVEATGHIPDEVLSAFEEGITVEGINYKALSVKRVNSRAIRIVLIEGKNREIRRVFSHFHLHPLRLRRVRIGPIKLGNLAEGDFRPLTQFEIQNLLDSASGSQTRKPPIPNPRSPEKRRNTW